MLTLKTFLCCRLEVGGMFLGIYCLAVNILTIASSIKQILSLRQYECDEFVRITYPKLYDKVEDAWCPYIQRATFTILSFNILYGLGIVCIACLCIQGTKSRNHFQINPMRIFLTIYVSASLFISVLLLLFVISTFLVEFIVFFIVFLIIYMSTTSYFLVVINSLYKMFKQEYDHKVEKGVGLRCNAFV